MNELGKKLNFNNWFCFGSLSLFLLMLVTTNNSLAKHFQLSFVSLSFAKTGTVVGAVIMNLVFVAAVVASLHFSKIARDERMFKFPSIWSILEMIGVLFLVTIAIIIVTIWIYINTTEGSLASFLAQVNMDTFIRSFWMYSALNSIKILGFQLLYCAAWVFVHRVFTVYCQKDNFWFRTLTTLIIELLIFIVLKISSNDATLVEYLVIHIFSLFNFQHRRNYWTSTIIVLWAEWFVFLIMILPLFDLMQ